MPGRFATVPSARSELQTAARTNSAMRRSPSRLLDPVQQFEPRNFRRGTKADGDHGGSYAAVDVELAAGFFVPSLT